MHAIELSNFGLENLGMSELQTPSPSDHEVLVKFEAASLNPRDAQIISGGFTPNVAFPLIPLSDGAGIVTDVGSAVTRFREGDRVTPLFFPNWYSGEAS